MYPDSGTPLTDQLNVERPFLCSTEGPFLRPTCPPGALQRAAVKDGPQGHRSSRRAASLRAVRCNAKLGKVRTAATAFTEIDGAIGDTGVNEAAEPRTHFGPINP